MGNVGACALKLEFSAGEVHRPALVPLAVDAFSLNNATNFVDCRVHGTFHRDRCLAAADSRDLVE